MKTAWIALGIIVVLALGAWLYMSMGTPAPVVAEPNPEVAGADQFADDSKDGSVAVPSDTTADGVQVTRTASGFSPTTVTVKKGTKVTFIDSTGKGMWVGVDDHPTHTKYNGMSKNDNCTSGQTAGAFDQCGKGAAYSFVFDKVGTWDYHDHVAASARGTIIVTE